MEDKGGYTEPAETISVETLVKRSRFIGTVRKVSTQAEAKEALKEERALHPEASSIAFAFIAGPPKSETAGMSDDGEPKGSAGRPIMDVLKGSGLRNALVTVTRYFGGTKLGIGGLVHAFGGCAKEALAAVGRREVHAETVWAITLPYEQYEPFARVLKNLGPSCRILAENFAENVTIDAALRNDEGEAVRLVLADMTRGRGTMEKTG
jgi:uncharacterized YigZ family protein